MSHPYVDAGMMACIGEASMTDAKPLTGRKVLFITLAAFDLVEPDLDLYTLYLDLYSEQIAGYYDPEEKTLFADIASATTIKTASSRMNPVLFPAASTTASATRGRCRPRPSGSCADPHR